ncbi:MAG: hypothetical protein O7B35_16820 [Deltaproteobacteria bacterium]|nr:hypothetical protein [Deltaproteobacteria bacterium]
MNSRTLIDKLNRAKTSQVWAFESYTEYVREIQRLEAIRDDLRFGCGPFKELSPNERERLLSAFTTVWHFFFSWPTLVNKADSTQWSEADE